MITAVLIIAVTFGTIAEFQIRIVQLGPPADRTAVTRCLHAVRRDARRLCGCRSLFAGTVGSSRAVIPAIGLFFFAQLLGQRLELFLLSLLVSRRRRRKIILQREIVDDRVDQ